MELAESAIVSQQSTSESNPSVAPPISHPPTERRLTELESRISAFRTASTQAQKTAMIYVAAGVGCAFVGVTLAVNRFLEGETAKFFAVGHGTISAGFVVVAATMFVVASWYISLVRRDDQQIADAQFEKDLLAFGMPPFVSRAEKLLSINQIQLRRYYELNLQQARAIFVVGILCMFAGLIVVAGTFVMVKQFTEVRAQIVVGVVGSVGSILVNYVAAVFFRMYGEVGRSIAQFHQQLAQTNDMFFANLVASGIEGEERSRTLVQLALAIAARRGPKSNTPTDTLS